MDDRTNTGGTPRRDFLKGALATLAATGFGSQALAMQAASETGIPTRPLGRTGERVSIVGLGAFTSACRKRQKASASCTRRSTKA